MAATQEYQPQLEQRLLAVLSLSDMFRIFGGNYEGVGGRPGRAAGRPPGGAGDRGGGRGGGGGGGGGVGAGVWGHGGH